MKKINSKTFFKELELANLTGLPFSWGDSGEVHFDETITQAQKDSILAVYMAHDPLYEPPAPIPSVVTMRQARLALLQGGLLATVNAAIAAGTDADKIAWEYATEVNRSDALVANMASALNLSSSDLDNLFTLAASL